MDATTLTQLLLFLGTVVTVLGGVWSVYLQSKQKASKDLHDVKIQQDAQRLEDIRELRERIDEQEERLGAMGKKLDTVSKNLRSEQAMNHRMTLIMQTHDIFMDQVDEYLTLYGHDMPSLFPRIPNRQHLKETLQLIALRERGDPPPE